MLHELRSGRRYRTWPPEVTFDWHDPYVQERLDMQASQLTKIVLGPRVPPILASDQVNVGLEVWDGEAPLSPSPSSPGTRRKPTNKRHARSGRPPDYPGEIIQQVARDYIEVYGRPPSQARLREKVCDECERNGFKVPGETRLKQLVDPIYKEDVA
jgi:hypothetical protein